MIRTLNIDNCISAIVTNNNFNLNTKLKLKLLEHIEEFIQAKKELKKHTSINAASPYLQKLIRVAYVITVFYDELHSIRKLYKPQSSIEKGIFEIKKNIFAALCDFAVTELKNYSSSFEDIKDIEENIKHYFSIDSSLSSLDCKNACTIYLIINNNVKQIAECFYKLKNIIENFGYSEAFEKEASNKVNLLKEKIMNMELNRDNIYDFEYDTIFYLYDKICYTKTDNKKKYFKTFITESKEGLRLSICYKNGELDIHNRSFFSIQTNDFFCPSYIGSILESEIITEIRVTIPYSSIPSFKCCINKDLLTLSGFCSDNDIKFYVNLRKYFQDKNKVIKEVK